MQRVYAQYVYFTKIIFRIHQFSHYESEIGRKELTICKRWQSLCYVHKPNNIPLL
jgi:hypothetical protein